MSPLLRMEVGRALHGRPFALVLVMGCLLAIVAAVTSYIGYLQTGALERMDVTNQFTNQFSQSSFTLWMPLSVMHSVPNMFFFTVPLLIGLGYAWSWRADMRNGYAQSVLSRTKRSRFYCAKLVAAFIASGLVVAVPLIINFAIVACLMPSTALDIGDVVYTGLGTRVFISDVLYQNPFLYVLVRTAIDFVLAGLWSTAVLALSLFIRGFVAIIALPYIGAVTTKYISEALYALVSMNGSSLTILDQLKARGDQFYYTGWALLGDIVVLLLITVAIPLCMKRRDVL